MRQYANLMMDFALVTEYLRQVVIGANQFCRDHPGYRLHTGTAETALAEGAGVIDGVIAVIELPTSEHAATRFGKPVVNISSICWPVPFPTVASDNRMIGQLAAEHLMAQGYRSFAYHTESRVYFSRERCAGFAATLEAQGHACAVFDTAQHVQLPATEVRELTVRWLKDLPRPVGLATHNDGRAASLIHLCNDEGLNVPDEVGVIGVDNDPLLAELCVPRLSSVDPGASVIGRRAAELLVQILQGKASGATVEPIRVPPRGVVVRPSTEPRNLLDDRLAAAMRYIRQHAAEPIDVASLLEVVPASRRSLERLFRVHLGRSPAEEIRRTRVNHAKWLLLESDLSLTTIAERSGFNSMRSFTAAFREELGKTAMAYRQQLAAGVAKRTSN